MKILKLKFKNINSLAGDWEIDFTQPEFTENGIFAITGKTGSGKSSILDAISLALYGKTPRVDVTTKNNDVMTRGTSDCYAEIAFEVGGKVWKATWKQERTRTKNLKPVQRVIADSEDNIVADQIKACDNKVEEILGLTFEQFTKVILLAQGSFAAFLQADKSDKGELLEQITGTEIYGEISRKVFEKNKEESQKLEILNSTLGAITILSEEEILKLNEEIIGLGNQKVQIDKDLQIIVAAQNRLKELDDLQKHINDAKAKLPELEQKVQKTKSALEQSEVNLKTAKTEQENTAPVLIKVRELDTKITEKEKILNPVLQAIHILEKAKNEFIQTFENQKKDFNKSQITLTEKLNWANTNSKYESLTGNFSAIENQNSQIIALRKDFEAKKSDFEAVKNELKIKNSNLEKSKTHFLEKENELNKKKQELETKITELSSILHGKELADYQTEKENITNLGTLIKNLIDTEKEINKNKKEIENYNNTIIISEQSEKELFRKISENKTITENLDKQINLLDENIKFTRTIQSLDEHRKSLEDGKPCPLCGALEHPFARGNEPKTGEKEMELSNMKKQFQEITNAVQQDEKARTKLLSEKDNSLKNKEKEEISLSENQEKQKNILSEIKILKSDFSIPEEDRIVSLEKIREQKQKEYKQISEIILKAIDVEKLIKKLQNEEIPQLQQAKQTAEKAKTEAATAQKLAEQQVENKNSLLNETDAKYKEKYAELLQKVAEYEVENIDSLKKCLTDWNANKQATEDLKVQIAQFEKGLALKNSEIEENQKQIDSRTAEKQSVEKDKQTLCAERLALFGEKLADSEENRLKKQISDAEHVKNAAEKAKTEANTECEKTNAIIQENEKRLLAKQAENIVEKTPEELQAEYKEKKILSDGLLQTIGAKKQELEANDENLEKNKKKLSEKEAQQQISDRWKRLDNLIGSADGKKYRNFAQALTFENLIVLANTQLKKMSERYILKRIDDWMNPFELSVIDKFQNYDERTAQNLSGGEKFIVSLALALGLANMASKNMKIDTMFIDEGFGTLDSDYLNVALTALSNLHGEGKLIGVISHLVELNERIVTHIEVIPQGDGHSKLKIA